MITLVVAFFMAVAVGNGVAVEQGIPGHDWTGVSSQVISAAGN